MSFQASKFIAQGATRLNNYDKPTIWGKVAALANEVKPTNLGQGFPSWNPPEFFMNALKLHNQDNKQQYTKAYGSPKLTQSIANFYSPIFNKQLDPNTNICVLNGGVGCLLSTFMALINPGDEVILLDPSYDCYAAQIQLAGGVTKSVPLKPRVLQTQDMLRQKSDIYKFTDNDEWDIDWNLLKQTFNSKTKAIVINSPHNPTGKIFSDSEYQKIAEIVKQNESCFVIEDQVYEHLTFESCEPFQLPRMAKQDGMWERCINVCSAGKLFSATGIRIGWTIGPQELIRYIQSFHQYNVFCVNGPSQDAVADALDQSVENGYFQDLNKKMIKNRNLLIDQLLKAKENFKVWVPQGGYFVLAGLHDITVDQKHYTSDFFKGYTIDKDLAFTIYSTYERGVLPVPCSFFYQPEHKKLGTEFVRYAICKDEDAIQEAGTKYSIDI